MAQGASEFERELSDDYLAINRIGAYVFPLALLYLLTAFCLSWWLKSPSSFFTDGVVVWGVVVTTGFLSLLLAHRERMKNGFYDPAEPTKVGEALISHAGLAAESRTVAQNTNGSPSSQEQLEELGEIARELNVLEDHLLTERSPTAGPGNWHKLIGLDNGGKNNG